MGRGGALSKDFMNLETHDTNFFNLVPIKIPARERLKGPPGGTNNNSPKEPNIFIFDKI